MSKTLSDAENEDGMGMRYEAQDAVLLLQLWFEAQAWRMSADNSSLIEDLMQEMSMAVLLCKGQHFLRYFKQCAVCRARDFMRKESQHSGRVARYAKLAHRTHEDDDTPYIEGLIDREDCMNRRTVRRRRRTKLSTQTQPRRASA